MIKDFVNYFNYLIYAEDASKCCQILVLSPPRKGLVITKNTEKFIISLENKFICIRIVETNLNFEKTHESFIIKPHITKFGTLEWRYETPSKEIYCINFDIIIKKFLSNFLLHGCQTDINHIKI